MPLYELKENLFMGLKDSFHYWRNYVTNGCAIARYFRARVKERHPVTTEIIDFDFSFWILKVMTRLGHRRRVRTFLKIKDKTRSKQVRNKDTAPYKYE